MFRIKFILPVIAFAMVGAGCSANVTNPRTASISTEIEARELIRSILFDQRTYYIENQAFTTSIENLQTMNRTMESPSYSYKIKAKPDKRKGVAVTATSKRPHLRSFTGVVFVVDSDKGKLTISEICETTQPSNQAPSAPSAPQRASGQIPCPAGSRSSLSMLALQ